MPFISVKRSGTQVLIGWVGFVTSSTPVSETMLIKQWGEKSKRLSHSPLPDSILLQPALLQPSDQA